MFERSKEPQLEKRLHSLEHHLGKENPILLKAVKSFQDVDRVAHRMGFFGPNESYATRVPWWPIISILGIYSAGKSTFINEYLGFDLQLTGNQAVDDKFTVISYSEEQQVRVLPGLALDADPRFPFYKISQEIDEVAQGEGRRIDAYLQLKTCPSDRLRGKIVIDSPGFDADEQRTAVLRITNYIVDLSDLVLVFFDARKPESGTMGDTLRHLVSETIHRQDSNKFLYILNQIDTTAREDNAEDVIASWQRALAQKGLTAGRFYRIYSKNASVPIEDDNVRVRYEAKRDADMKDLDNRIQQVGVERSYRIVGTLERTTADIETKVVPKLRQALGRWRSRTLLLDALIVGLIAVTLGIVAGDGLGAWWSADPLNKMLAVGGGLILFLIVHFFARRVSAAQVANTLRRETRKDEFNENYVRAFERNTRFFRSIFRRNPVGWGQRARDTLKQVNADAGEYVQALNNAFTNPSGTEIPAVVKQAAASTSAAPAAPATGQPLS